MANYTPEAIVITGLAATVRTVAASDTFDLDDAGRTFLRITNGGGGSTVVTITGVPATVAPSGYPAITFADPAITIGAGLTRYLGPFEKAAFRNSSGRVTVAFSVTTSVTMEVVKLPAANQ